MRVKAYDIKCIVAVPMISINNTIWSNFLVITEINVVDLVLGTMMI